MKYSLDSKNIVNFTTSITKLSAEILQKWIHSEQRLV